MDLEQIRIFELDSQSNFYASLLFERLSSSVLELEYELDFLQKTLIIILDNYLENTALINTYQHRYYIIKYYYEFKTNQNIKTEYEQIIKNLNDIDKIIKKNIQDYRDYITHYSKIKISVDDYFIKELVRLQIDCNISILYYNLYIDKLSKTLEPDSLIHFFYLKKELIRKFI
jgi:hypothetical protein